MPSTWLIVVAWVAIGVAFASAAVILTDIHIRDYRLKMPIMEAGHRALLPAGRDLGVLALRTHHQQQMA